MNDYQRESKTDYPMAVISATEQAPPRIFPEYHLIKVNLFNDYASGTLEAIAQFHFL